MGGGDAAATEETTGLPAALADALAQFCRHLRSERGLCEHSVRAYRGDLATLLEHARRMGRTVPTALDLPVLRSWLAGQSSRGMSRATLARRAAAARGFTAWLLRDGLVAKDVGSLLATPRGGRTLPGVLRQDEADALLHVAGLAADDERPTAVRDLAVLEVLYASGIRVGELCGLDLDDVDRVRRVLRVLGKGAKERTVPVGAPALRAVDRWLAAGRPRAARSRQRRRTLPRGARGPDRPAHGAPVRTRAARRTSRARRTWARTVSATPLRPTCWKGEPT